MSAKTDVGVYKFNHTMFRIKDPKVSIPFYEKVLGMEVSERSASRSHRKRRPGGFGRELGIGNIFCPVLSGDVVSLGMGALADNLYRSSRKVGDPILPISSLLSPTAGDLT
jgi:hypothetical protein